MTIRELLDSVQFVTDSQGQRKAVQLDWELWEQLIRLLEDLEDSAEIEMAREEKDDLISWEEVLAEYETTHQEVHV